MKFGRAQSEASPPSLLSFPMKTPGKIPPKKSPKKQTKKPQNPHNQPKKTPKNPHNQPKPSRFSISYSPEQQFHYFIIFFFWGLNNQMKLWKAQSVLIPKKPWNNPKNPNPNPSFYSQNEQFHNPTMVVFRIEEKNQNFEEHHPHPSAPFYPKTT